jgi:hypothetical protein
MSELQTLEEVGADLKTRGFHTAIRDWNIGHSLLISRSARPGPEGQILDGLVYIAAFSEDGKWWVYPSTEPHPTDSLQEAVEAALQHLKEGS